jgi:hypothetical protein
MRADERRPVILSVVSQEEIWGMDLEAEKVKCSYGG